MQGPLAFAPGEQRARWYPLAPAAGAPPASLTHRDGSFSALSGSFDAPVTTCP
jgi:hypothetical protein